MEFDYSLEPGKKQLRACANEPLKPLVSIVTPYYNAGLYIEQTFTSVINQTFPWFEWIIVNDGSKKEEVKILEEIGRKDARIRILHQENGGTSKGRNHAIAEATTDIIIPLDADDLIEPTYIECLYWGLHCNPDYDWAYTDNIGFHNQKYLWRENFDAIRLKTFNFLVYSAAIRKTAITSIGGYGEEEKHFYEDWHLWLRLVAAKKKPLKLGFYGFWYRRLDNGLLAKVNNTGSIKEKAKRLIETEALKVNEPVTAKQYPLLEEPISYKRILLDPWWRNELTIKSQAVERLLLIIPWMEMGGADLFNLNLLEGLTANGYEVVIITTVSSMDPWRQKYEAFSSQIYSLPAFLETRDYCKFIHYIIDTRDISQILVTNSYIGYYMLPWLRKSYPEIPIMDYVHMEEWYWKNGGYARTSGVFNALVDRTLTCNERTRQVLIDHFEIPQNKVQTIYIGTDVNRFDPERIQASSVKERYDIPNETPVILFPCRLHPQKRPFLMMEIAKGLHKRGNEFRLLIVGDGDQRRELEGAVPGFLREKLIFTGEQKDMAAFYRDSHVTLICSIKEGLSLTAYESLAMSIPVVSSDVGGQRELIDENVGMLIPLMQDESSDFNSRSFPAEEVAAYVEVLERLIKDKALYERKKNACRNRILSGFSTQKMIEAFLDNFKEMKKDPALSHRKISSMNLQQMAGYVEDAFMEFVNESLHERKQNQIWKERMWFATQYEIIRKSPLKHVIKTSQGLLSRGIRKGYYSIRSLWVKRIKYTSIGKKISKLKSLWPGKPFKKAI